MRKYYCKTKGIEKSTRDYKLITFDLDTKKLTKITSPYYKIYSFMDTKNFKRIQRSVYLSTEPMSKPSVELVLLLLKLKHPWLKTATRSIYIANIGDGGNYTMYFK